MANPSATYSTLPVRISGSDGFFFLLLVWRDDRFDRFLDLDFFDRLRFFFLPVNKRFIRRKRPIQLLSAGFLYLTLSEDKSGPKALTHDIAPLVATPSRASNAAQASA